MQPRCVVQQVAVVGASDAMAQQQPSHMNPRNHREERFFSIALRENETVIRQAMEHALGIKLDVLSTGLWVADKVVASDCRLDIMVRALPVQGGTSIEVDIKPRWTTVWGWFWGTIFVVGCMTVVPLIWAIWYGNRRTERVRRHQLVHMHRTWTELAEAVGAPVRADGYRAKPKRVYQPTDADAAFHSSRIEAGSAPLDEPHSIQEQQEYAPYEVARKP
jgi:hypothetical protein